MQGRRWESVYMRTVLPVDKFNSVSPVRKVAVQPCNTYEGKWTLRASFFYFYYKVLSPNHYHYFLYKMESLTLLYPVNNTFFMVFGYAIKHMYYGILRNIFMIEEKYIYLS